MDLHQAAFAFLSSSDQLPEFDETLLARLDCDVKVDAIDLLDKSR